MHFFAYITLLFIGFAIYSIIKACQEPYTKQTWLFIAIGAIIVNIDCLIYSFSGVFSINTQEIPYSTEQIQYKIFSHTPYGEFESEKKRDFELWTKGLPGYVSESINAWGMPIGLKEFKVEE